MHEQIIIFQDRTAPKRRDEVTVTVPKDLLTDLKCFITIMGGHQVQENLYQVTAPLLGYFIEIIQEKYAEVQICKNKKGSES